VCFSFFILIALSGLALASSPGKFVPADGKILFIVGQDKNAIREYVSGVGIVPGGTMCYTSIQQLDGLEHEYNRGGGVLDGQHLLDTYPDSVLQIGLWMVDGLEGVANGVYDENIDRLGAWIKKAARPVFLRIGYEFDLPLNHYEPAAFVKAWRHMVDRLRNNGVDNVAFVWHSYAALPPHPWIEWYPGDDYVDWVAASFFGQPNIYMSKLSEFADDHGKPFMIAESTPKGLGTKYGEASWKHWFDGFFKFIADKKVKAVCYINWDWETIADFRAQGWGDTRVEANAYVKQAWIKEITRDKYLQASGALFHQLGYR
jgi:hypothetical protein